MGAPKRLPLIFTYYALVFSVFLTRGTLNYVSNVVVRSYDRACSRNCMPEYKLIQKKKKKKKKKSLNRNDSLRCAVTVLGACSPRHRAPGTSPSTTNL
jgi:hypothetical protein